MKTAFFLVLIIFFASCYANAQSLIDSNNNSNDSLILKAKKLKQLYILSTLKSNDIGNIFRQQFFDEFPNTFNELNDLYGDNSNNQKPTPLSDQAEEHIVDLFNNLKTINDTLYYKKIISIAIGGHWDVDAVNFFQHGLRNKVLTNLELVLFILKDSSDDKIQSFWHFFFDRPHPEKELDQPLQKIKLTNKRIYGLMVKAQNDVLKESEK